MKLISILSLIILFFFTSCTNQENEIAIQLDGNLINSEITSYQYGSHILINNNSTYALKSNTINLNDYSNEKVVVIAEKISGYPVDGGPLYLNVLNISIVLN